MPAHDIDPTITAALDRVREADAAWRKCGDAKLESAEARAEAIRAAFAVDASQQAIASTLGVSRVRVGQILEKKESAT
jgi:predicted DNA-binding protein (UPF0251 family)